MEQPGKKMDIHITLGQQNDLQFLTDTNGIITSNPSLVNFNLSKVENILTESQIKEQSGDDILLVFHFYVEQGKEK
jgi:hypothetical protein